VKLTVAGVAALAGLLACAGTPAGSPVPPAPATAASPGAAWRAVVRPFPVADSTGRDLTLAFLGGFNVPRPQLADLDGDGDLDLTIHEWGGRMLALRRDGTGADGLPAFSLLSWHWGGLDVGEWSRFTDLDQDGDLDLLAEWPFSYLRYFRNDGSRGRPAYTALPDTLRDSDGVAIFADRQNIPQLGDVDCNGRADLLIGRVSGVILRYELAERAGGPPVFQVVDTAWQGLRILTGQGSMHGANTMALFDADDDGDLDLIWGDFFEAGLLWFRNLGSCAAPVLSHEPSRFPPGDPVITSGYNAPAFGDLDGDGRPDLVVGVLGGAYDPNRTSVANLHFFSRGEDGRFLRRTAQLLPVLDVGSESVPALADLDGDGDLDLLLGSKIDPERRTTGLVHVLENVGSGRRPAFRQRSPLAIAGSYHMAPATGDLDGDGRPDLLLGGFGARVAWYRGVELADSALVTIPRGSNTVPALGDLDGDGDLDLLVGEASGSLNYYRNDGTARAPAFVLVSEQFGDMDVGRRSAPVLADLDRDGDLDLLVGSDDAGLQFYRNEGTRTAPRFVRDPGFRPDVPPISAPAVGDLDGDGVPEIVVGAIGGGAMVLLRE
jgi:hypothetical protein